MTSEQSYNTGGIELTACQLHEALLMAGTPELGVPFEDRGRVRIFQSETGHSGPGLYCECVDVEEEGCILLDGTSPAIAAPTQAGHTFQAGVAEWMGQCFLPSLYSNMTERGDRLLEEVLELLQAHGYDKARVPTLVDYVFGRPVGEPAQEVGGVMVTLAGYCWVAGLDMHANGQAELDRINQPDVMAKIRAKQEAKNALHFDTPLPGHTSPPAQAVDLGMQQDAARWRAIAPHLSVEWDEDEMLKRWTWIDFKGDALSVPTRTRESYASVDEAIDAVIDSQAVGNG